MDFTTFTLKDGGFVPSIAIGTGTSFSRDNAFKVTDAIVDAVKKGYRLIDTAQVYQTEEQVGKAIRQLISQGVVKRQDLFVTSKMPPRDLSIDEVNIKFFASEFILSYQEIPFFCRQLKV